MKRIFPIISFLILLSLLGLIFFQFLWLKTAKDVKEQQLNTSLVYAVGEAGQTLVEDVGAFPYKKKSDIIFPTDKFQQDIFKPSVINRFSKQEIHNIIRRALDNNMLKDVDFEFAVTQNSLAGEQVQSENFFKYYVDSANHTQKVIPLIPPSGSKLENLAEEEYLVVIVPHQRTLILKDNMVYPWRYSFTLIISTAFFITIRTLIKQKKLSEIKSDFINNMTHEFKTPLATISLAVDALKNEKVSGDKEKTNYFTGIIKEENKRMNKQVETILQAALLDKQKVELNLKKVSAHSLINAAVNNITLPIEEKEGNLVLHTEASNDFILADEVHFTNLINSLLDNAVKYSKEHPVVKLSTSNVGHNLKIKIEDNGIGMNKETLHRIFEKFYRAHTGNIHNVKGFGLGLSYVKTMVEAHKGNIKADSTLGRGSCFIIQIPLAR